ncbi:MAG: ankyrin repeat domain-containing protein [Deltaproteobacteria bacterium]|nr:ankyrin repeat domain-containing protein [Deltaproteobacteria bacterium]
MTNCSNKALDNLLQSVSDVLFPDELGNKKIAINTRDSDGDTPLHVIARRNDLKGTKILVNAGADVNAIDDMGETPLHVALSQKTKEIVKALLEAGANPNIRSEFGETAMEKAAKMGHEFETLIEEYLST